MMIPPDDEHRDPEVEDEEIEPEADDGEADDGEADDGEADDGEGPLDLNKRFLCADGACIGVIGRDGRCKVCGKPIAPEDEAAFKRAFGIEGSGLGVAASASETPPPKETSRVDDDEDDEVSDASRNVEPASKAAAEDDAASSSDKGLTNGKDAFVYDPNTRVLCSDGACIGIIGPDGRCKECGKPYEGELAED